MSRKNLTVSIVVAALFAVASMTSPTTAQVPVKKNGNGQKGSGGTAVAHYAGGARVGDPSVARKAPDARLYRTGLNSTEPTLGVTEDNKVFYSAFQTNTRVEVMRSSDEGNTWDVVSPKFPGGRNAQ